MNTKGMVAGMLLAILILTGTGAALDFNAAFSIVYGQVTEGGAGVNGANVSLTANGVTITTKTMTNNRGENGFYIFELANIPKVTDTTPLTLSVTVGTKSATTTITRGENGLKQVDLVPVLTTPVLTTIIVTPSAASVAVGGTRTFVATTLDQSGNPIAASVTWNISNPIVGTINAAGVFIASAAGTATVTATNGTVSGTATVTVETPVLTTITVSPQTATVVVGNNRSFGAAALDQLGNPVTATVTWSSSNTTVGTINAATGLFTANAEGVTTITAASGGVSGTATVTAARPVLTSITVSPDTATVAVGNTQTFTAAPKDQVGNPIAAVVTWNSSNTTVGIISSAGVFTAKTEGITTITAASGGVIGIATATVVPAGAAITPQPPSSGGGGGGGGGITTSEPYENIEKSERHDNTLIAGSPASYVFTAPELGIHQIIVTGKVNEYDITVRVEALKGTSKLAASPAPGKVYKNMNIWAGTKQVKDVLIKFKVADAWMSSSGIASGEVTMVKWDGSKWVQLETKETGKDSEFTRYETKTDGFSAFAITGIKAAPQAAPTAAMTETRPRPTAPPAAVPTEKAPGYEVIAAIATLSAVYIFWRKRR